MNNQQYLIMDFDSTFVTVEAVDELAQIAIQGNGLRQEVCRQITKITSLGMSGEVDFGWSLRQRLGLIKARREHITRLVTLLRGRVTPSIARQKDFFRRYSERIYIVSGGFKEFIVPVVVDFGIVKSHVLANSLVYDAGGWVIGFDEDNPLVKVAGKADVVKNLGLKGEVVVLGDGVGDWLVKKRGAADKFYVLTENVVRSGVVELADGVVESFEEFLRLSGMGIDRQIEFDKIGLLTTQ